jgi:hypothetical protein
MFRPALNHHLFTGSMAELFMQSRLQALYLDDRTDADIPTALYSRRVLGYRAVTMPGIRMSSRPIFSAVENSSPLISAVSCEDPS